MSNQKHKTQLLAIGNIVKTLQTLNISNNPQIEFHPDLIFIYQNLKIFSN